MGEFFYNLGRMTGRKIRKPRWVYKSYFGSAGEAILAEYAAGREIADQMKQQIKISSNPKYQEIVNEIGYNLVDRVKKKERRFEFNLLDTNDINAFALPGGFIFISNALMDLCELNPDEIASVLSHEIVHIVSGHPLKRIMTTKSLSMLSNAIRAGGVIGNMAKQTLTSLIESNYSQENELHADFIGVQLMASAGYDPQASARMLQRLRGTGKKTDSTFSYFSTHPPIEERIRKIKPLLT